MDGNGQPPMAWRYCGNQIKLWRTRAGVTREQLGNEAGYGCETIRAMESGRRRPTVGVLRVADVLCRADGMLVAAEEYLLPEKYPVRTHEFMDAEASAICVNWFEPLLIPGLLQTADYARALISDSCPPLDDETIEGRVAARLQRQAKLNEKPMRLFSFILYEAALRTGVGGTEVMRAQLHHLLEVGLQRNVSIQVLPADGRAALALIGPLVLLESPTHEYFAYVEAPETSVLYSDAEKLSALTQRHGMIRMHALSVEESSRFIGDLAEEL
ncbi:helix-turn-helix domain-containing protein [Yinghuangia seranimata]|uniref:helix-turn-helix domain-containing protein n=1 Tax=Yinghuangia seranimata TaxID=408067 RepID=UPI00248CCE44|nr:helix-turn-helix transcriptional regulator [Yinghuangia seranimata]MDI2129097.1 helix-turn-helix transcriptional regulator [Yinghuangia seranimata]